MKENLIKFETAKLAKEKGFDWKCYWYCFYKRKIPTNQQSFYPEIGNYEDFNTNETNFYELFSLPTQSFLQKWLREEHFIHISVNTLGQCNYHLLVGNLGNIITKGNEYRSYEEALEQGLIEALKLIKNE